VNFTENKMVLEMISRDLSLLISCVHCWLKLSLKE